MPFESAPTPRHDPAIDLVAEVLDPALVPLGFAAGQGGGTEDSGQVIFCRGFADSTDDGCVDLVVELTAAPWRVSAIRYWGYPSDRWQLPVPTGDNLHDQLHQLVVQLPIELA